MKPITIKRLPDAKETSEQILRLVEPLDYDTYMESLLHRLSVERLMITLGEALNKAVQQERDVEARIPDARQSIDFRHRVIHGYDSVDSNVVWVAATRDVPILLAQINEVLVNETSAS
jgi:uncharacterized protein with HEPN domain